jgi:hypothetical protein
LELGRREVLGYGLAAAAAAPSLGLAQSPAADDPHGLMRHRFGVNYTPSRSGYYCYNDWRLDAIARDLDRVAEIGADHIRAMVIWPWFQPNPKVVSTAHLDRLDQLMRCAGERGLDVQPCLYTGWLSGYHFNPDFYQDEPFYTSAKWADAQDRYLAAVAARMRDHPNFLGFDIGNEMDWGWRGAPIEADRWMKGVFQRMRDLYPDKIHVNGVSHAPWFADTTFSAQALVTEQPIVALHCWPFWTGAGRLGGPLDDPYTRLSAGMAALARGLGQAPRKPIWIQEFGVCALEMPQADLSTWLETSVSHAIDNGVSWFTWWASHDISRNYDFQPFEYGLGLMTNDNQIKEQGRTFRRLADHYRGKSVTRPQDPPPPPAIRTHDATWAWLRAWMRDGGA